MTFPMYLSLLVCVLFLSVLVSCFLDSSTEGRRSNDGPNAPAATFQETAGELAYSLLPDKIVKWRIDAKSGESVSVYGENVNGQEVFRVVFNRTTGDPRSILFWPGEDSSAKGIMARSPRELAEFWLRRISESDENPYRWIRDGQQGKTRYFSVWQGPTRSLSLTINTQTGHIIAIHFFTRDEHTIRANSRQ